MFAQLARGELEQDEAEELFGRMTDVCAARTGFFQLQSLGWEAYRFTINELLAASGIPVAQGDDLETFDSIVYVRAAR